MPAFSKSKVDYHGKKFKSTTLKQAVWKLHEDEISTGQIGGFDFGLNYFLTTDEGQTIDAPQFFREDLPCLCQIQRQVSKKIVGSENQRKGKQHLARRHIRISDKRRDFHYQLAHELCMYWSLRT